MVEIGDRSQWSHDPFSGLLLDGSVYGRGTTDCKHLVLSELEALESLFAEGFRPDYDLYLSLGYSEEVYLENDVDGAQRLVDHLAEKGVHIGTILDEGADFSRKLAAVLPLISVLAKKRPSTTKSTVTARAGIRASQAMARPWALSQRRWLPLKPIRFPIA